MKMECCGQTHVGLVRRGNEDSFHASPDLGFFVVADGLGGEAAGERASGLAVEVLSFAADEAGESLTVGGLVDAVQLANRRIRLETECDPTLRGMATTVTAAIVRDGTAEIVNVGDSRAYRLSGGKLECLTTDHTWIQDLANATDVSPESLKEHPYRHTLTRAVGAEEAVAADTVKADLAPGDVLLLCSDGLHGVVPSDEIAGCLESGFQVQQMAQALIDAAIEKGAPDNVTVIVVQQSLDGPDS